MKRLITLALTCLTLTMSAQNKLFTLDDLMPGGSNYSQLQPDRRNFSFDGDKVVEDAKPAEKKLENTALLREHNIYIKTADGKELQVTRDGSADIVYGEAVHRNEYGIMEGLFWSPDRQLLAFYRMDQSMVSKYPQVNITPYAESQCYPARDAEKAGSRCAVLEPDAYPMAGEASHLVTVGIYDVKTQKTVYLQAGDPKDRYFTNIAWNPDSRRIYMIELNRDVTDLALNEYDATSGKLVRTLLTEHHDKYVEPMEPIRFLPWDSSKFVYTSRMDGFNHYYLYRIGEAGKDGGKAQLVSQLTSGKFEVMDFVGFASASKSIIYKANESGTLNQSIYAVGMNGKRRLLGNAEGWHGTTRMSESGKFIIDYYSTPHQSHVIDLINVATGKARNLFTSANKWEENGYAIPTVKVGTIKAADGVTDLNYRLILPVGFDSTKTYPCITYVYGGPHAHNIDARYMYSARPWDIYMAHKGYVMFCLDNRGSENRGREFEQATFRKLGVEEMKDQLKGMEFLKSLPYVDAGRMGIHGWSFGGYMTSSLLCSFVGNETPKHDGLFAGECPYKVGVAGGPVIDWRFYEIMYGERYMDTPQTNPEGYENTSLLNKAQNLRGRLQVIYGYNDPTCVPQHTISFLRACIDAGTHPDLFTYPGDGHNMSGKDRIHLHEHITRYFEDYLK